MQAGCIGDDGEEKENSQVEASEGEGAAERSETAAGVAAVEGLLSSLALSESAAEQPGAPDSAGQAAAGGEMLQPDGSAEHAPLAADNSTLRPAKAAGPPQAPASAEDPRPAQADAAGEANEETSVAGIESHPLLYMQQTGFRRMLQLMRPCSSSLTPCRASPYFWLGLAWLSSELILRCFR